MTNKPTPKDIDLLVRTYLGDCGPQANRVYPFVTAVLAKWGQPAGAADSVLEDAERLDWLDQQCEAYGFQDIHEGNLWEISGPYANVRKAIDAERAARKQGGAT